MDDSLLPNDGELFNAFQEPEEQVTERRVEQSKAQAAKPLLEELIARKQKEIDHMKSVDAITVDPEADTEGFMRAWYGVQQVKAYAETDLAYLESLLLTTKR